MYVVLGLMLVFFLWAISGFGQKDDQIRKRMELREELHRKMLENLFHGTHDDKLFENMEKMFEESMKDSFGSSFTYSLGGAQNFQTEWAESSEGRTLIITPQSKEQKLDINVQNEMVTIKGKSEIKTQNGISVADFQNSFSIPQDCDSTKVKMDSKNGKIVMHFPWKNVRNVSPKKDERIPIPKSDGDVAI